MGGNDLVTIDRLVVLWAMAVHGMYKFADTAVLFFFTCLVVQFFLLLSGHCVE